MLYAERLDDEAITFINFGQFAVGGRIEWDSTHTRGGKRGHRVAMVGVAVDKVLGVSGVKTGDDLIDALRAINPQG